MFLRVRLLSDTHLPDDPNLIEDDVPYIKVTPKNVSSDEILILLGDIGNPYAVPYKRLLQKARSVHSRVILVPGNHEYYQDVRDIASVNEHLDILCKETGVIFLNRKTVEFDGIKFVGATCWPKISDSVYSSLKKEGYSLVTRVKKNGNSLDSSDFKQLHDQDLKFIEQETSFDLLKTCVVLTHYPPDPCLLDEQHEHSPVLSVHYNEDGLYTVKGQNTKIWMCGHTHTGRRYWAKQQSILLVTNCYKGDEFDPDFALNITPYK